MRKRFEQQTSLGLQPINDVVFPMKSRDELPAVLRSLQYIFITPSISEAVFSLLEKKILLGKKKTGRTGMDLWHILVLAVVRHSCNTNWDSLETCANYNTLVRAAMGVHSTGFMNEHDKIMFSYQTILDNVSLIDAACLQEINLLVVKAGHCLVKKKEDEALMLKTDSYVVEKDVHFPTDLNLLWDSCRKSLDFVKTYACLSGIKGWRKVNCIRTEFFSTYRRTTHTVFKGKDEKKKKAVVREYVGKATELIKRITEVLENANKKDSLTKKEQKTLEALKKYLDYMAKFTDQISRRLLEGEKIAHEEKVFSIFEPDTEWITKGKLNNRVELGHMVLVTSDQHHFIVDYKVMYNEKDAPQIPDLCKRLKMNYRDRKILGISFDKGFYSKDNIEELEKVDFELCTLPKRGRHTQADKEREGTTEFRKRRNAHSAIESNINMLEHHGLGKCRDKGYKGFERCVGLSILAYNLHRIGNILKEQELKKIERLQNNAA
jgi:hypothetical protein